MRLLAIDTALAACSAAVLCDGAESKLITASEHIGRGHAERLTGMIGEVMAEAGVAFDTLDRIAVTVGPGSFTGLRVGLAVARGFAVVLGIPVIGVTTLEGIAAGVERRTTCRQSLCVVLDARGDDVYWQRFAGDGTERDRPGLIEAAVLAQRLAPGERIAGSGAHKLIAAGLPASRVIDEAAYPDIADIARLGARTDPGENPPGPCYLRPPDARPQPRDGRLLL